jgi:hypothetical protein
MVSVVSYTLGVGPSSSNRPTEQVSDYTGWTLDQNLDDGCSFQFDTRGQSSAAAAIDEMASDLWLYQNGTLIQRFRITNVDQSWGADGSDDVSVRAICYRRMLSARTTQTTLTYIGQSQGAIAWDLIQHTQAQTNGSLGITLGDSGPAVLRDRTYDPGINIMDAITDFTITDQPFVWEIDANRVLYISSPTSAFIWTMPLVLGVNARALSRPSAADKFANAALVLGNTDSVSPVSAEAATLATDPRGRWERVISRPSDASATNLAEYANGLVQESISPAAVWRAEMEPSAYFANSEYESGDWLTVIRPRSTVYPIGTPSSRISCQVIGRRIAGSADGNVTVELSMIEASQ